ncbi:hypothetical protein [Pseudonocardia sp. NPDC049635]|uniref:hypothetical protein n=1 Tax=Pseudonocardia sp. NPDC049635 TaxID=3155506 RepID=UPI0033D2CE46
MTERRRAAVWQARANRAGGRTTRALDDEIAALLDEGPDPGSGPAAPDLTTPGPVTPDPVTPEGPDPPR